MIEDDFGLELAGEFMTFNEFVTQCDEVTKSREHLMGKISALQTRADNLRKIAERHFEHRVYVKNGYAYIVYGSDVASTDELGISLPVVREIAAAEIVEE